MTSSGRRSWRAALAAALFWSLHSTAAAAPAGQDTRYVRVTLRGRLTAAEGGAPLVGAIIRFTATEGGEPAEVVAKTDDKGAFALEDLGYASYTIEITTREGESIRGINDVQISGDVVEVILRISEVPSGMEVRSEPGRERMVVAITVKRPKWKRFWREFAVFFGIAAGAGAAAL